MKKYLVVGDPIKHSFSPTLHNYWFKKNKISAIYEKRKISEKDIKDTVTQIRNNQINGIVCVITLILIVILLDSTTCPLQKYPTKVWDQAVPTDPLIYRLYEIVGVYGDTLKEVIQEKFGDGIMSAIDFSMHVDKEENPKGDRVVITMNGKFLPYKAW